MADEEVKPVEEPKPEATVENPEATVETKEAEIPLAEEETLKDEIPVEAKAEEKPPEEPKPDWRERELKSKHRQNQELKRQLEEERNRREAAEALAAKFNQRTETETPVVPVDEVDKRAKEMLAQQRYVEDCNKTAQSGEKTYGATWKDAVQNLELLGGFDQDTMNGILASDDPAKALYELGRNPEHYHRIMELPLHRRIIEIGKISMQPLTPKKVSEAPPPVNPIGGRAAPAASTLSDDLPDEKWFAMRRAQRRAKWEANNPRR